MANEYPVNMESSAGKLNLRLASKYKGDRIFVFSRYVVGDDECKLGYLVAGTYEFNQMQQHNQDGSRVITLDSKGRLHRVLPGAEYVDSRITNFIIFSQKHPNDDEFSKLFL